MSYSYCEGYCHVFINSTHHRPTSISRCYLTSICIAKITQSPYLHNGDHYNWKIAFYYVFYLISGISYCQDAIMMTSWNAHVFGITSPLGGESTGHRCIPFTKGQECQPLKFLWCYPEQIVEQTLEWPVIWDAMMFMWRHYNDIVLQ